jgi:outer membrane protein assembly factor BamB
MTDRSGMSGGGLFYTRIGAEGNRVVVQSAGDPGTLYAYDAATGKQAWKVVDATYQGYLKGRAELEVGHGMAVLGDSTGLLVCHDLSDGRVRWKLNVVAPVETILLTPDHVLLAMAGQWFSRDRDMRLGSTSLAAKGKWLVVGTPTALSILDLATGVIKDQTKSDVTPPPARQGKSFPFGKSFASVSLGPEGILWGIPSDSGTKWTLLR